MKETDVAIALGLLDEPVCNRVPLDAYLRADIYALKSAFQQLSAQKSALGSVNPDLWCELVPWHSMN
ncbi:MAG: hypothetical protein SFZ03_07545 [Candidatus Melainabacteria bacterium]|nr:hypothetical protein [Candidatus Melainabacteria bacterium]